MSKVSVDAAKAGAGLARLQVKAQQLAEIINGIKDAEDACLPSTVDVVRTSLHSLTEAYFDYAHFAWKASLTESSEEE